MATTFKTFISDDVVNSRTLLHEAIPITGSIIYGTYGVVGSETHVKTYAHGMFQSVYDYPYLSSSANHIFDMTFGHHVDFKGSGSVNLDSNTDGNYDGASALTTLDSHTYYSKRNNIYNQMAQVLMGHDASGAIQKFDIDGNLATSGDGTKYNALIFFNLARLLTKDEIKKGTFEMQLGVVEEYGNTAGTDAATLTQPHAATMHTSKLTIKDDGAATSYKVNSPAGEYGILKVTADDLATGTIESDGGYDAKCGLIFYQAGVVALTPDVFMQYHSTAYKNGKIAIDGGAFTQAAAGANEFGVIMDETPADLNIIELLGSNSYTMDQVSERIRQRIVKICFNNTTELNSSIYFCRANHNDFNYSSNPTYLNNSKIRVKNSQDDAPVSYVTTVGLYSADNELLAVAKLSEPLRKDPTNDLTLRVRLDY